MSSTKHLIAAYSSTTNVLACVMKPIRMAEKLAIIDFCNADSKKKLYTIIEGEFLESCSITGVVLGMNIGRSGERTKIWISIGFQKEPFCVF